MYLTQFVQNQRSAIANRRFGALLCIYQEQSRTSQLLIGLIAKGFSKSAIGDG